MNKLLTITNHRTGEIISIPESITKEELQEYLDQLMNSIEIINNERG